MAAALAARRAELAKPVGAAAKPGGYLELTVHGKQAWFEYSIKEMDASGKEVGSVIVREGEMLKRVLARTKADPTAPKELRVIVVPSRALTGYPTTALKACDAAGYTTVKFTGYVFGGGLARELKPDEKGEVPGYKRYAGDERSPASLIKEIEDGMRTF